MTQKFILHVGHECDPRLKTQNLYDSKTDFRNVDEPIVHIMAPTRLHRRKVLYEKLKRITSEPITSILYPMTWAEFMMNVENVTADDFRPIQKAFATLQPPVQYIDCDKIELAQGSKSLFDAVISDRERWPELDQHKTPHHKETISEHTIRVAEEIVKWTIKNEAELDKHPKTKARVINSLHMAALYHDLGKYWTGQLDESVGYHRYPGHENVSAMIFVSEMLLRPEKLTFVDWADDSEQESAYSRVLDTHFWFKTPQEAFIKTVTQIILNHKIAKTEDFTSRLIRRRLLNRNELWLMDIFTTVDNRGRTPEHTQRKRENKC